MLANDNINTAYNANNCLTLEDDAIQKIKQIKSENSKMPKTI